MAAKLDYNQIMVDASNRLHAIINACINKDDDSIICNTCSSMYSSEKDMPTVEEKESDVPRFLAMLEENHIPAEYCVGLFSCWCSCEGAAATAEKCMDIQAKYDMTMTAVWEWVCNNEPLPNTDWTEEVDKYKEAIND